MGRVMEYNGEYFVVKKRDFEAQRDWLQYG